MSWRHRTMAANSYGAPVPAVPPWFRHLRYTHTHTHTHLLATVHLNISELGKRAEHRLEAIALCAMILMRISDENLNSGDTYIIISYFTACIVWRPNGWIHNTVRGVVYIWTSQPQNQHLLQSLHLQLIEIYTECMECVVSVCVHQCWTPNRKCMIKTQSSRGKQHHIVVSSQGLCMLYTVY